MKSSKSVSTRAVPSLAVGKAKNTKIEPELLGTKKERADFAPALLAWARVSGRRGLPWQVKDAYAVWVSEIMLQQTQVETVKGYYAKFMGLFPNVLALAAAAEESVLEAWAGLGYYRRAKLLHKAAKIVVSEHGGALPRGALALAALPGIGRSTAAAIASIAQGERVAILDGNVARVLARRWGFGEDVGSSAAMARLWATAEDLCDAKEPGLYTQSIMDLGATVCAPRAPACERCPFESTCVARASGRATDFPFKRKSKKARRKATEVWRVWCDGSRIALIKNTANSGVWQSMTVFAFDDKSLSGLPSAIMEAWEFDHVFSHYSLSVTLRLHRVSAEELDLHVERNGWQVCAPREALALALPAPVRVATLKIEALLAAALSEWRLAAQSVNLPSTETQRKGAAKK